MEITPANQGTVEHSSSRQSESSEIDKMIGSAHLIQKSSSFEEEESSRMVEQNLDNFSGLSLDQTVNQQDGNPAQPASDLQHQPSAELSPSFQTNEYSDAKVEESIPNDNNQVQDCVTNPVQDGVCTSLQDGINISQVGNTDSLQADMNNLIQNNAQIDIVHNDWVPENQESSRKKLTLSDKQTSTTSLEEQNKEIERESAAECLLKVLTREASSRPASLPADLASLWHSLKIASELNKSLKEAKEESDTEGSTSDLHNGIPKPIDLQKLFTPAEDATEILPRNKKMFASSSFYGPNHPTVEEQVELARRISSSLSDISNKESKGQSMYVNRKKRSVKWIHTGEEGQQQQQSFSEYSETNQSENLPPTPKITEKPVLKLVMNPRGQVQDFSSLKNQVDATPSPEVCFDLVKDLNSPCGKGAELFAKRRKKAEKWVVDESNVKTQEMTSMSSYESYSTNTHTHSQLGKLATPTLPTNMANLPTPTYLKDIPPRFGPQAAKNQIPDKYTQPKVRLIKSPWEAALEGSVENAFQDQHSAPSPTPRGNVMIAPSPSSFSKMMTPPPPQSFVSSNDIYAKPPKAWHPQPTGKQLSDIIKSQPEYALPSSQPASQPMPTAQALPTPQSQPSSTPSNLYVDLKVVSNFNTAPRGWQSNMSYYRPVTFTTDTNQYTDF